MYYERFVIHSISNGWCIFACTGMNIYGYMMCVQFITTIAMRT